MNNSDLLEKLDMIKEAVERNPGEWWRDLYCPNADFGTFEDVGHFWSCFTAGWEISLKPQQVRVEGWVDNDSIEWLRKQAEDMWAANRIHAKALLQLVKDSND